MAVCEINLFRAPGGPRALPEGSLRGLPRVCLFVHGYNVDPDQAKRAFDRLIKLVRHEANIPDEVEIPALDGREAWRVYWPAYASLGMARWTLSPLTYSWHVADAEAWANALERTLSDELAGPDEDPVEVTFVAHSLGCRLTLEVLRAKLMNRHTNWRVHCIFFMAAAVPVHLVEFDERLCRAAIEPVDSCVAYSLIDTVLQLPFRIGQVTELDILPTAVGASGQPAELWRERLRTWNGHGGYFKDPRTARRLASKLGLATRQELDSRYLDSHQLASRNTAEPPPQARRSLGHHRIGG